MTHSSPCVRWLAALMAVSSFACLQLPAQVVIRERIQITPQPRLSLQASSTGVVHTIQVVLEWDRPLLGRILFDDSHCLPSPTYGYSPLSVEGFLVPGTYAPNLQLRVAELQPGDTVRASYRIVVDGTVVRSGSTEMGQAGPNVVFAVWRPGSYYYQSSAYTGFQLVAGGEWIYPNQQMVFDVVPEYACTGKFWSADDPMTFTITEGMDGGTFFTSSGDELGDSFTAVAADLVDVVFVPVAGLAEPVLVTVEAVSAELTSQASFEVRPLQYELRFRSVPEDLVLGKRQLLEVDLYDPEGYRIEAPSGVRYTVEVTEGAEYGYLLRGSEADRFTDLRPSNTPPLAYGYTYAYFVAQERPVDAPQPVTVEFSANSPVITAAKAEFTVLPGTLVIEAAPGDLVYGQSSHVTLGKRGSDGVIVSLPENTGVTLRLTRGVDAGGLAAADTGVIADEISGVLREARFTALEELPQPDSVEVGIYGEAVEPETGATLTGMATVVVRKVQDLLDHFEVRVEHDTVAFTETSKISVQAKDINNEDVELDAGTALRFLVTTNDEYGTFIDKNGDTLKTTPVELDNVTYGEAHAGIVRFAAVKKNPDSVVTCRIRVESRSDATKKGEKDEVVVEQALKIVMAAPFEVEPVIPPAQVNNPRAENRKQFTVRMTRSGKPVANHAFRLTTDYVDGSGGHDHITPRRAVSRENYGHFILRRGGAHLDRPYDGQTQANGKEEFDYVASIFGDRTRLRVDSRVNPLLWDTISVAEKVPDLEELGFGEGYELVGSPENHAGTNDPCRPTPPQSEHEENHFGSAALVAAVQNIAATYDSLHAGIRLRINDMSLEYGGLFDVGNTWRQGLGQAHAEHRIGQNCDVGFSGLDEQNECVDVRRAVLFRIIGNFAAGRTVTHDDHYHIRMR